MQNKLKSVFDFAKKCFLCRDAAVFVLCLTGAGFLSVWLEQELMSDFLSYHYYNGFAFLNNRLGFDIAPAQTGTFYNPLLDTLLYLTDDFFSTKRSYLFAAGVPAGLALFFVYKIADLFFPERKKLWIPLCLAISLTGYAFYRQIGTCTHEITTACFVLGAFYILLKRPAGAVWYFIAGAILGSAAGLKLTAALYCVSSGITLILFYKTLEKPKMFIGAFILGGLTGFLLTNGFWMWTLWKQFQNPFFPFWNKIFKSPYFFDVNYRDDLHLSYDWKKMLFLPFRIFAGNIIDLSGKEIVDKELTSRASFSDARWMVGYFLLFFFALKSFGRDFRASVSEKTYFTVTFMVVSYLVWLLLSQNVRLTVPVEMLFGVVFIKALSSCPYPKTFFKEVASGSAVLVLYFILLSTPFFSDPWGPFRRFSVPDDAVLPEKALILTSGPRSSYFATKFAERTDARIINSGTRTFLNYSDLSDYNRFLEEKKEILDKNMLPVLFIVTVKDKDTRFEIKDNVCYLMNVNRLIGFGEEFAFCSRPKIINGIFHNGRLSKDEKDAVETRDLSADIR